MALRALVADDSVLFRRLISDVLSVITGVEVVGTASNGKIAVQKVRELQPDIMTLDIEMPEMDGLAVLDALRQSGSDTSVIMVSSLTLQGGRMTMKALEKGAFDFITKPDSGSMDQNRKIIQEELIPMVRALLNRRQIRSILKGPQGTPKPPPMTTKPAADHLSQVAERMSRMAIGTATKPEMVLIGVSTGGPNALAKMMPSLPANLGVPVLIVQHMPPIFTQSLAESLSLKCKIQVREASDGEVIEPNCAYIAPGGKQMRLISDPDGRRTLQITDDPPENNCKPSVDYLFRSVSNNFPGRAMAVILTGMGSDGTLGMKLLKRHGIATLAQDETSCVVYGMPKAAVEAGVVDTVLPLDQIADKITSLVSGRSK